MIPQLQAKCEEMGVELIMNTTANEILSDANGAAVGIAATDKNGAAVPSTPRPSSWPPAALAPTWTWWWSTSNATGTTETSYGGR